MNKIIFLLALVLGQTVLNAQVKVGIMGGANESTILETNNLSNWNTIKSNYDWLIGAHGGLVSEIPFNRKATLVFQPAVLYYNKGRKYFQRFDTTSFVIAKDSSFKQTINYIEIPLNLLVKIHLGRKFNFLLGGGPYFSFLFNGRETSVTNYKNPALFPPVTVTNSNLSVGNAPGKYATIDYGATVTAGFEIGKFFIRATGSQSLADVYQAANYKGSFKNQVLSVSAGVWLASINSTTVKKKSDGTHKTVKVKKDRKIKLPKDRDNDGIPDKDDLCPDQPGTKETMGCPDRDGDGVADKDDLCPDVKGDPANHGCPIVKIVTLVAKPIDSDGDGIPDSLDKCPTVFGYYRYNGCPIPDTDGDGVNDEIDHCPTVPGLKTNHGCPLEEKVVTKEVIEQVRVATPKIQFTYNKADLLSSSFKALDEVAGILLRDPYIKLRIEGHASMEGRYEFNQKLSEERANAVKNYLVQKGIDAARLSAVGFGSARVLTIDPELQTINRRVEMILSY